jgi:hypothetical protein
VGAFYPIKPAICRLFLSLSHHRDVLREGQNRGSNPAHSFWGNSFGGGNLMSFEPDEIFC